MKEYLYDVAIVGAGPAGLCASIAASRQGKKVLVVEKNGYLGGNCALGLPLLGFLDKDGRTVIKGIAQEFIDDLSNWFVRRSRRRFWKSENDSDKTEAYEALYIALKTLCKVAAPFIPFITEEMYLNLKTSEDKESVHLCDYPEVNEKWLNQELEFKMATVQKAVSMGHSLRNTFNLKNRQPLASVALVTRNAEEKRVLSEMEDCIREELNVKKVIFHEREDELVEYKAKANFKVLGKELGPLMKKAAGIIAELTSEQIVAILEGNKLSVEIEGKSVELDSEKVLVDRFEKDDLKVLNEGTLTVGLDSKVTDDLKKEGYVRDLIRGIQNQRKESGLNVTDRIKLTVAGDEKLKSAYLMFVDFICNETLTSEINWADSLPNADLCFRHQQKADLQCGVAGGWLWCADDCFPGRALHSFVRQATQAAG